MSFLYPASRTPYSSASHDFDHANAPLLAHSSQQRSYHTAAADPQQAAEAKEEAVRGETDVEEGRRSLYRSSSHNSGHSNSAAARSKRPNYAAPILPFPSPSRATTVTINDGDEAPYESPFSAFSAYQSDYSSPGDTLSSAYASYAHSSRRSLLSNCWASTASAVKVVLSTLYALVTYPVTHPRQTSMAMLCASLLVSSSGEQVTRKLLASSLYNYRYALFLLLSLASALLSSLLTLARWRTVRSYLTLSTLPPFLPVLLLVLLSAAASLLLLLSTAILPAPLALLFPQLLLPLSLLTARWWARRQVKRDVSLGCALIVLAVGVLAVSAVYRAEAQRATDAFVPSRAEVSWNILLLAVSVLLSAAVWQVRSSLLCAYDAHPLVLSSLVGWGQLAVGLLLAPAALWLQYLGTDRWQGVNHPGPGGGVIIGGGNTTLSSSSSTVAGGIGGSALLSSLYASTAGGVSRSSSVSSSAAASFSAEWWSSSASTASDSSTASASSSAADSSSPSSSLYLSSSTESSTAVGPSTSSSSSSSSSDLAADPFSTSLSSISLLTSTATASVSSTFVPPSLSSSLVSILSITSSYLFSPLVASSSSSAVHNLPSYHRLLLPVIPSPDYLPAPSPAVTSSHHYSFHASTLLNLQHFSRCLLFAHDSEYGDTCSSPVPLIPLTAFFVLSCLTTQYAIAALSKRASTTSGGGGVSGVLVLAAVLAVLCFVWPAVGVSDWLPYHQRVLLDGLGGGDGGAVDGGVFVLCVVLLCVGCWLCGRQEERAVAGVNVWERVEALMREQETRGSEESRERRAAVRRARDRDGNGRR